MHKKFLLRHVLAKPRDSVQGSSNPLIPVIAAFIFFIAFVCVSLWFTKRSRGSHPGLHGLDNVGFPAAQVLPANSLPATPHTGSPPGFPISTTPQAPALPRSPFSSLSAPPQAANLDPTTARQLIESWLAFKKTIFSSPYNTSGIENYVINPGPLYSDITRPGGSVDWLRSNKSSYYYNKLEVLDVADLRQFPDRAHLTVRIVEDLELRTPRGTDHSKSGNKIQTWVYELKLNQGKWLVYDYRKDI